MPIRVAFPATRLQHNVHDNSLEIVSKLWNLELRLSLIS